MAKKAPDAAALMEEFAVEPGANQLAELSALGQQAADFQRQLAELAEVQSAITSDLQKLLADRIPTMLSALNMASFKLQDGTKIEAKEFWNGSLPKEPDRRKLALEFIEKNGGADLIKFSMNLAIDRGDKKMAEKVRSFLLKAGVGFDEKQDVHAQTLAKFARELLADGKAVPLDTLGLYVGKVAKVTLPALPKVEPAAATKGKRSPVPA